MFNKKSIGVAVACALAFGAFSGTTFATTVDVDGVLVNTSSPLDLNIQAVNFRESSVSKVGDVVMGYGQIGTINGDLEAQFCPSCDLNFTFQYTVSNIDNTGPSPRVVFDGGLLNFYVAPNNSFKVTDPTSAGIGTLWLSLAGHTAPRTGFNALGQLYSGINGTVSNPTEGSFGFGLLDVTGGAAAFMTDTNTIADGIGGFADFRLGSSFQFDSANICANGTCYPISGTGQLIGKSVSVPEPGAAGLLGVGLAALGLAIRRRRNEAAGRV